MEKSPSYFSNRHVEWRESYIQKVLSKWQSISREYHRKMIRNKDWKYIRIEKEGSYEESLHQYKSDQFDEGPNLLLENTSKKD